MSSKKKRRGVPAGKMAGPTTPREAAFRCIEGVMYDDTYANLTLPPLLERAGITGRDAGFATELTYGALRMRGLYDEILGAAARRPYESVDNSVRISLWLGIHQALSMRVPAHAAVNETVDQARRHAGVGAAKFVNAVMRRVTERDLDAWTDQVAVGEDDAALGIRYSHLDWTVTGLREALAADGREGELTALLAADNTAPSVTLVARPGLVSRDELAAGAEGATGTPFSPWGVTLDGGAPGSLPAVKDGTAAVQDEGSQLAAGVLWAARPVESNELWLDMCSGPGGKAALLGALAAQSGAHLDAIELHEHRADLVRKSVRALPEGAVTVAAADALQWQGGPYDRILLDAPCTGMGALRRRPEARWRRTESDLKDLIQTQTSLLGRAAELLRPEGVLAYVTCSPLLGETREQVSASGLKVLDAREALATVTGTEAASWGENEAVQLWPHVHGTDAMFIALLTKSA